MAALGNSTLTIDVSEIDALPNQLVPGSRGGATAYGSYVHLFNSTAGCWMDTQLGLWATAPALALALGAVGAVVAFVIACGVDALFVWAGRYC